MQSQTAAQLDLSLSPRDADGRWLTSFPGVVVQIDDRARHEVVFAGPLDVDPDAGGCARTRAALAAYDAIDSEITDTMTQAEATEFFKRLDTAKVAIGDAFALDTSDRNDPEVARSWAAFSVDRTRKLVVGLAPIPRCPFCGTDDCGDCRNC
jgi:hypothetical protein